MREEHLLNHGTQELVNVQCYSQHIFESYQKKKLLQNILRIISWIIHELYWTFYCLYITKDDTHGMNLKILDEMQTGVDIDDSQDS